MQIDPETVNRGPPSGTPIFPSFSMFLRLTFFPQISQKRIKTYVLVCYFPHFFPKKCTIFAVFSYVFPSDLGFGCENKSRFPPFLPCFPKFLMQTDPENRQPWPPIRNAVFPKF